MDISSAIEEYLACKQASWTHDSYAWYRKMLGAFLKWCETNELTELAQLSPALISVFVQGTLPSSDNTKHHRAQVVKGFLRWCAEDEDFGVRAKVVARIEMPKVEQPEIEVFSQEDIARLLAACEHTRQKLRNKAMLLLLLDTGVRLAELVYDGERPEESTGLLLEHVVIVGKRNEESYIIVMGKGRKSRTVKFGRETRLAVQKYINHERGRSKHPYLFLAQGDAPLSVRTVDQLLKKLGEIARVENTHAHRFRHTFAMRQLLAGTSAFVLMQLLGHTTLEATKTYVRALSQMQARQASVSVVDEMRKKRASGLSTAVSHRSTGVSMP